MDTTAPTTVNGITTLEGATNGPVTVVDGGALTIVGTHNGGIVLEGGGSLLVEGVLHGSVDVGSLAMATVTGDVVGRITVRVAGTLVVDVDGRLAGPVANYGSFTNRGVRSGPIEGREPDDQAGAIEVEPLHPGGVYNYVLPDRE